MEESIAALGITMETRTCKLLHKPTHLQPYQIDAVNLMAELENSFAKGGLLADACGAGKHRPYFACMIYCSPHWQSSDFESTGLHQQNVFWSLGVSGSCRTRILGWLNPRVHLTDAVRFRCTWEHMGAPVTTLGAPRITVEQTQKNNIFFGNAVGVPGNHSYYLSFNDFQNSYIHFVFWSLYLCVYVSV